MENRIKFNQMLRHSFLYSGIIVALSMSCGKEEMPEDMPDEVPIYYTAIAAGAAHSLALEPDGTLWAWGANSIGQLGERTFGDENRPVRIGSGYGAISAGTTHSLALKTDSTLWAWGSNEAGQLGDGTFVTRNEPLQIGVGYTAIAAVNGYPFYQQSHSLALKSDGTLWAWGGNGSGQLGDGTVVNKNRPVLIGSGFAAIDAGAQYTIALKEDGTLWAWGALGNGTYYFTPEWLSSGFIAIAAGYNHFLALKSDRTIWAQGRNGSYQLGDGSQIDKYNLVRIGSGYAAIAAGGSTEYMFYVYGDYGHSLALTIDGKLRAWGDNFYGQLGDGSNIDRNTPKEIGSGYATISAGGQHSLALKTDGTLWAWGANFWGQLGDGSYEDKNAPVQIKPY